MSELLPINFHKTFLPERRLLGAVRPLWRNRDDYQRVVYKGCWPLHPLSTWLLQRLAAGRELQQRSAVTLLVEAYRFAAEREQPPTALLRPVDLLTGDLLEEFVASKRLGGRSAAAQAYQEVMHKYGQRFSPEESTVLKAVLLATRLGLKIENRTVYRALLVQCCGLSEEDLVATLEALEGEYGVLSWNAALCQYDIVADAVPRQEFLERLKQRAKGVGMQQRAEIFRRQLAGWL